MLAHLTQQVGPPLRQVATFGTPLDVAASELAIETFLPADEATRTWLARQGRPGAA